MNLLIIARSQSGRYFENDPTGPPSPKFDELRSYLGDPQELFCLDVSALESLRIDANTGPYHSFEMPECLHAGLPKSCKKVNITL